MKKIFKPSIIKTHGNKPKLIEEYVGNVNTNNKDISIAKMSSPKGWVETSQTPKFNEYTIVISGVLKVTTKDEIMHIHAGEGVIVEKGEWVQYSTPLEDTEYVAVCLPAFSNDLVNRN